MILEVGGDNLFLALFIATFIPFLLGTSLPVVPTYILSLSILAPSLLQLGIDEVTVHLFFIYWAILGGVTPPTCTQAIVAAGIAKSNWFKTALVAVRLGIVAFIIPYFFVLNPALAGRSDFLSVFIYSGSAFIGAIMLAFGFFAHINNRFNFMLRVLFVGSGLLLIYPNHILSIIGILVGVPLFYFSFQL